MRGIILAGGSGTRLYPVTKSVSKQLLNVYDKPMIYYPLSVLMMAGIRDILIITTEKDQVQFKTLLGDGRDFGINISYTIQPSPDGLAQAFILGKEFIGDDASVMILGDNIFYGSGLDLELKRAVLNAYDGYATIFGYQVKDPERFGIMEVDNDKKVIGVEEKPKYPKSDFAITGLYFYPKGVSEKAINVKPSLRGELEITTLNDMYLKEQKLKACLLDDGYVWFDTGTFDSMKDAIDFVSSIQKNKDKVICCPEVIAYNNGWLSYDQVDASFRLMEKNSYGQYLKKILINNRK